MTHDYEISLYSANPFQEVDLVLPTGGSIHYVRISPGASNIDAVFEHTATPTRYYKSTISWNGNGWDMKLADGTLMVWGANRPLQSMRDRYGNTVTLTRASAGAANITRIESSNGRFIDLQHDAANHITSATDNIGRTVTYEYDLLGRMTKATYPDGSTNEYIWPACSATVTDACTQLVSVKNGRGNLTMLEQQFREPPLLYAPDLPVHRIGQLAGPKRQSRCVFP